MRAFIIRIVYNISFDLLCNWVQQSIHHLLSNRTHTCTNESVSFDSIWFARPLSQLTLFLFYISVDLFANYHQNDSAKYNGRMPDVYAILTQYFIK